MTTTSKYLRNGFLIGLSIGGVRAAGQVENDGATKTEESTEDKSNDPPKEESI